MTTTQVGTRSLVVPAVLAVVVSGAVVASQGRLNGDLSTAGAGVLVAALVSFVGTFTAVVLAILVTGRAGRVARALREQGTLWWYCVGVCGIPSVLGYAYGIPIVGTAVASVCVVAGQIVSGLTLDARGIGLPQPIRLTGRRLAAAVLAVAGLGLGIMAASRPQAAGPAHAVAVGLMLFVAGAVVAGQIAGNGRVAQVSGEPLVAGFASQVGGTLVMAAIVAVAAAAGGLHGVRLPSGPGQWYLYLGGPIGVYALTASAWAVRHLGTFALTLAAVGGQLATALVVDLARGVGTHWTTYVAVLAIATATALGVVRRAQPSSDVASS